MAGVRSGRSLAPLTPWAPRTPHTEPGFCNRSSWRVGRGRFRGCTKPAWGPATTTAPRASLHFQAKKGTAGPGDVSGPRRPDADSVPLSRVTSTSPPRVHNPPQEQHAPRVRVEGHQQEGPVELCVWSGRGVEVGAGPWRELDAGGGSHLCAPLIQSHRSLVCNLQGKFWNGQLTPQEGSTRPLFLFYF